MRIEYGYKKIETFAKYEDGKRVDYYYSINYDRYGNELSRTEPVPIGSIGWMDGTDFMESDYRALIEDTHND